MKRAFFILLLVFGFLAGCGNGDGNEANATQNGQSCTVAPGCGDEDTLVVSTDAELEAFQQRSCNCVGDIRLTELGGVERLEGFNEITSAGELEIRSTTDLQRVDGFEGLTFSLSVIVRDNESLEHFNGFSGLEEVTNFGPEDPEYEYDWFAVHFQDNPELVTVEGLSTLRSAPTIEFMRNGSLVSIPDFESLEEVGDLTIVANPELAALPEFGALRRINGILMINGSPQLRECDVEAMLDRLEQQPRGMAIGGLSSEPCDD